MKILLEGGACGAALFFIIHVFSKYKFVFAKKP